MGKASKLASQEAGSSTQVCREWRQESWGVASPWCFNVLLLPLPMHVTCLSLVTALTLLLADATFLGPGERWAVDQSQASYKSSFPSLQDDLSLSIRCFLHMAVIGGSLPFNNPFKEKTEQRPDDL